MSTLYRLKQPVAASLEIIHLLGERFQLRVMRRPIIAKMFLRLRNHRFQPDRCEDLIGERLQHQLVQFLHRDVSAIAGGVALGDPALAFVVAIFPALARGESHPGPAAPALQKPGQEGRAIHYPGRHLRRRTRSTVRVHPVEGARIDDRLHRHLDPLHFGFQFPGFVARAVEDVLAPVEGVAKEGMDFVLRPLLAPQAHAPLVQVCGNAFLSQRSALVAIQVEPEHLAHGGSLQRVDLQALFLAAPARGLSLHSPVAQWWLVAVEVALPGVLLHRPQRVLAVLLALVLIEQAKDGARHLPRRIVARLLRNGYELDPGPLQGALIAQELEQVAEEPRAAVDDDRLVGRG
ncbi:MAG: hypothetical protein WBM28_01970 [Burkholderiales bacterium]